MSTRQPINDSRLSFARCQRPASTQASLQQTVSQTVSCRRQADIAPAPIRSQEITQPISHTLPVNTQAKRKFWVVPDRPRAATVAAERPVDALSGAQENQSASQSNKTLPEYTRSAVAKQLDAPFLVTPESISGRNVRSGDASALAGMQFSEAAQLWVESQKPSLRERTFYMYRHHLTQLAKYFGDMKLDKIHLGHLDDYQKARRDNRGGMWQKTCGASIINHEMSMMQQVLKRAKLWTPLAELYNPVPLPVMQKKKVLDDIEERRFFAIAASRPEWELAALVVTITRNTTAAGSELRNLRFQDVILDAGLPRIVINGDTAKNAYRGRVICLNETAKNAIERCMERARKLGSSLPHQYLFPKRITTGYWNPELPASASWLRVTFGELRKAAGIPWLTPHCFRHMAITVMLEKGAAPETVRHIAGHVSEEMMRHYSHNRHATQVAVLQALDSTPKSAKRPAAVRDQRRQFMARGRRHFIVRRTIV